MKKKQKRITNEEYYYDQSYYGPQEGYQNNQPDYGQSYYGPQEGYQNDQPDYGQPYYGPQEGYQNGQSYYGPREGYQNGQPYYGPQAGYQNGPSYYGPQEGYQNGQPYYGPQEEYQNGQPYYNPQQNMSSGKQLKKKKNRKAVFLLELVVLLILAVGLFAAAQLSRMEHIKLSEIIVNTGIGKSGYRNIALFGVDSRHGELESGTNSDAILVASINQKTGEIKLVSVYRDTYLDNTNGEYRKATECYAGGGAERAVNMLNKNLDLDIKDFVTVDFNGIIAAVDKLGGIGIELTEEERGWLNAYLVETSQVTGVPYTTVDAAGYQHLTGIQAMAYCRIRYTEGWDYKRTERQRIVLEKMFEAAQAKGVVGLTALADEMLPYVSTSLNTADIVSLASGIMKYRLSETSGFPFDKATANIYAGDVVVPVNLANNVTQLHQFLFGTEGYVPSDTVQEISYRIINDTGIQ